MKPTNAAMIGLWAIPAAVYIWARHDEKIVHETTENNVLPLVQTPLTQNSSPQLDVKPTQFPTAPRHTQTQTVTAHIGDQAIEVKIDFNSLPSADTADEQNLRDYPRLTECLEHMSFGKLPQTDDEMRSVERHLREMLIKNGNHTPKGRLVDVEQQVELNWRIYRDCKGATQEQLDTVIVELGESTGYRAREAYAHIIEKDNPDAAHAIFEQLWKERGRVQMIGALSHYSVPHEIAYYSAMMAVYETDEHWRTLFNAAEARMDRFEFREASQQAAQILSSPNCCFYP